MFRSLLLAVGIIVNPFTGEAAPQKLTTSEVEELPATSLAYVSGFFRHGIRAPIHKPFPNYLLKDKYEEYFSGQMGQLTKMGMQQMYSVGKKLSEIYGNFVGDYSEEKVRVTSTEISRTIVTALSVMAGLFPPKEPLFKDLNWQPIPIWQDTKDFDKVYLFNDPQFPELLGKQCPRYAEIIEHGYEKVIQEDLNETNVKVYKLLEKESGAKVNSFQTAYEITDILEFGSLNGLPLPDWSVTPQTMLDNKPLYPDLMKTLKVKWFQHCLWLGKDEEKLHFFTGPLFDIINDKFKDKITKKEEEKFRFHATHDTTLYLLVWVLGFDDPDLEIQPGDGIVFELHMKKVKEEESYFVQVVYYHSLYYETSEFREVLELPKCHSPCPFDTFSTLYPGLTPKEWEQKCNTQ